MNFSEPTLCKSYSRDPGVEGGALRQQVESLGVCFWTLFCYEVQLSSAFTSLYVWTGNANYFSSSVLKSLITKKKKKVSCVFWIELHQDVDSWLWTWSVAILAALECDFNCSQSGLDCTRVLFVDGVGLLSSLNSNLQLRVVFSGASVK